MPKDSPKYVPAQRFVGMQVIDGKGSLIGNVKDVSVDFQSKGLAFRVNTKARTELDMSWDDVLSVEDVVLLKKELDLSAQPAPATVPSGPATPAVIQAMIICPTCGASAPSHARFCPKCGTSLK